MKQRRKLLLAVSVLVVALVVLGVALYSRRAQLLSLIPTPPIVVTEHNYGQVVHVLQGQRLAVELRGNSLSGSVWRPQIQPPFLALTDETFMPDSKPATPGDGTQTTIFRVTDAGQGPLFLDYTDQADQNALKPTRTFSIVVVSQ